MQSETSIGPIAAVKHFVSEVTFANLAVAVVAFLFAVTGPVAIMLTVGSSGGLTNAELATWLFGAFTINGVISVAACVWYRQPLVFLWSIPGIVLVGTAIGHLRFSEIVGAYLLTGVFIVVLGFTGLLSRISRFMPMPIVMGMVAGVFLQFGVNWIQSFDRNFWIAAPMTAVFFAVAAWPAAARRVPPLIVALVAGIVAMVLSGNVPSAGDIVLEAVSPVLFVPEFTVRAAVELVVPLAITVLVVQNGQGLALLDASGHRPRVNMVTIVSGVGSIATAGFGTVSTCLTGPVNGILCSEGHRSGHYTGGVLVALMLIPFGIMAPLFTSLILSMPAAFVSTLAGIALLRVLQASFVTAFEGRLAMGGLIAFIVTVSGVSFLNVGAPFWGLVSGIFVSWVVEREQFRAAIAAPRDGGPAGDDEEGGPERGQG